MAGKPDLGGLPKRRLTTYGKGARKRQPKTAFTPVTASESMSDEDPITASQTTATRQQPTLAASPRDDSPPRRYKSLDGANATRTNTSSPYNIQSSERKRKLSQVYTSKGHTQETLGSGDSSPSAPKPRRSRTAASNNARASMTTTNARMPIAPRSTEPMEVDLVGPRLSSPPLTPTPPKASKPKARAAEKPSSANTPKPVSVLQQDIPLHLARNLTQKSKQSNVPSAARIENKPPVAQTRAPATSLPKKPRKRLIDALVEQIPDDSDDLVDNVPSSQAGFSQQTSSQTSDASILDSQGLPTTPTSKRRTAHATVTRTFARSSSSLKFTYGQGRKVLEDEDNLMDALALPEEPSVPLRGRRLELGGPKTSALSSGSFDLDVDVATDGSPNAKLRDIHELRQAGANSRVADAMQDLKEQLGTPGTKPSSSRRAALLQVAEKIGDKTFMRQCRDHGVEATMLKDVGTELDNIAVFLILSILVTILAKWPSAHMARLVRLEDPGPIFARLLGIPEDVKKIVKDRKSNLSRRSQTQIISIHNSLRDLPIWDGAAPQYISPRSIVIKCLRLLIAQDTNVGQDPAVFTRSVTEGLFEVLSEASQSADHWNYPTAVESSNLCGALAVLDVHAVSVGEMQRASSEWSTCYLPIIADVFTTSFRHPAEDNKTLENSVLKLAINMTNNNIEAPDIFASKGALPALAASISHSFTQILTSISQDAWKDGITDSLVLRLGILINFAEHSSLVRQVISDSQHNGQKTVDEFIQIFLENHRKTNEADSLEKSHLNVAFGYLSVLLGYLSLHAPVRQKLKSSHSARSIGPLIDSIREFTGFIKKMESTADEDDEGSRSSSGYTEQLQSLVHQLEDEAVYD
ncbi:Uu.00g086600.m01.CDS01 [Anthostomella pinea]|uniref:Uu.00g086600.m01.CDS01 n=1 Tax=Anthostomella pinea TaxID=933095 RepID=A0AAI8VM70_9PEZI|nr:Uu.00g086600.m01.CDS01 [Anthostomella pinea]